MSIKIVTSECVKTNKNHNDQFQNLHLIGL
jgi:hypothetical protein